MSREKAATCVDVHRLGTIVIVAMMMIGTLPGAAQTYSVLHTFTNSPDGANPAPITMDAQGNLYGTTRAGGIPCIPTVITCGTVFKVDRAGTETVLYSFQGLQDGAYPIAGVIRDEAGNLYGTTEGNGVINAASTVFKIDRSGNETVLYDFNGPQGCCQDSPLALDSTGNIYGTSPYGGDEDCGYQDIGCGSIYRLTQAGKISVLHVFKGTDGIEPEGGVVIGVKGGLYGTTVIGGDMSCYTPYPQGRYAVTEGCGTIFRVDDKGKLTLLHVFERQGDGSAPLGLTQDSQGNLYGIASYGGDSTCLEDDYGCGTIFKVDTVGKFSVLYRFTVAISQPDFAGRLVIDSEGNLYGVNAIGGANNSGFIFQLSPRGDFSIVYSFPGTENVEDGSNPQNVVMDATGNFYGSMLIRGLENVNLCGAQGCGTVFSVTF